MSNIGKIKPNFDGVLQGYVETLDLSIGFFVKQRTVRNQNEPVWDIIAKGKSGREIVIGAGWEKNINSGENMGQKFYSISMDDPSFPKAFYCTAFADENGGFDLVFSRPRQQQAA